MLRTNHVAHSSNPIKNMFSLIILLSIVLERRYKGAYEVIGKGILRKVIMYALPKRPFTPNFLHIPHIDRNSNGSM